ncbi:MAG: NAD-binding protein, partial [Thermoguttaceae bacterium]|nr:NAD-binding protein [Thermoguttaceae bacterium]
SSVIGIALADLKLPPEVRIAAINRDGNIAIATAVDKIEVGDRVTLMGTQNHVENVKKMLHTQSTVRQNVIIAGGGETGYHLAQILEERNYNVTILDAHRNRCDFLSSHLGHSTVICGDARRKTTLEEERASSADIFVACIGDDENNIMACVEAMELGAKTLMAVIHQPDYAGVVGKLGITETISPYAVMIRQIDGLLHQGPLVYQNAHLLGGNIDVVELIVEEDSRISQNLLQNAQLPRQVLLAAVIRDNYVQVPNATFQIKPGDNVVALVHTPQIPDLVKAFEKQN